MLVIHLVDDVCEVDPRLALKTFNCSLNLDGSTVKNIWLPDIYFINDKKSYVHDITKENRMLRLYPDGTVFYGQYRIKSSINI